jgi:hypothetical protein
MFTLTRKLLDNMHIWCGFANLLIRPGPGFRKQLAFQRLGDGDLRGERFPRPVPTTQAMLPGEFVEALYDYDWPGNVRELQNVLQRYLATEDLTAVLALLNVRLHSRQVPMGEMPIHAAATFAETIAAFEKQVLMNILAQCRNHTGEAASRYWHCSATHPPVHFFSAAVQCPQDEQSGGSGLFPFDNTVTATRSN